MSKLEDAIAAGQAAGKLALFFGRWDEPGHFLHLSNRRRIWDRKDLEGFCWNDSLMDGGLLKNGRRTDVYDGKVFWTAGGAKAFWYAFFWWDRSGDRRGASNSGFYVRGFGWPEAEAAFAYACEQFPTIVARQRHALALQMLS